MDPIATELQRFIRLQTERPLTKPEVRKFMRVVERHGPQNIVSSFSSVRPDGEPAEVRLVHRRLKDGQHLYDIPLKRDLTEREAMAITEAWDAYYAEGDFLIETSADMIAAQAETLLDAVVVQEDDYEGLCEAIAKSQHEVWYRQRVNEGWRYGEREDRRQKTHPLLRPWGDLPERYRQIDYSTPQVFLEELNRQGYLIVRANQLESLAEGRLTLED